MLSVSLDNRNRCNVDCNFLVHARFCCFQGQITWPNKRHGTCDCGAASRAKRHKVTGSDGLLEPVGPTGSGGARPSCRAGVPRKWGRKALVKKSRDEYEHPRNESTRRPCFTLNFNWLYRCTCTVTEHTVRGINSPGALNAGSMYLNTRCYHVRTGSCSRAVPRQIPEQLATLFSLSGTSATGEPFFPVFRVRPTAQIQVLPLRVKKTLQLSLLYGTLIEDAT